MVNEKVKVSFELSDILTTAVVLLDTALCVSYMNVAAEVLFGQSRQRVMGKPCSYLFNTHIAAHYLEFALHNRDPQTLRECTLKTMHEEIIVDCIASPLRYEGDLEGVIVELRRIDQQLRLSREHQLWKEQEATQTLVRGLAHEIKNPLGGVRGAAQLLEGELIDPELKEYTHIIISEADRLKVLVDRMLGSPHPQKKEPINIHEVLERVRKLVQSDLPEQVKLRFDYDPSIPELCADKDRLIQIVLNITGNAVKAVGNQGLILFRTRVMRYLTLNRKTYRLVLRLEIIDDGEGVPKALQDKVFFPMISGSAEGTGLGLSIAQSLANKHNGLIEFESKPGRTRFVLLLPISDELKENN
ncbi:MAG: PAS domain-containing protein [Cocleimonas sp.]|nr:PAS domain-containing protein [Cocleimonas sp.]